MKREMAVLMAAAVLWSVCGQQVLAQRGAGNPEGVARQAEKPKVVKLEGKLKAIKTGPCEATTGCSPIGTHILLETAKGEELNIHLGPASAVNDLLDRFAVGQEVIVQAFRTPDLKEHHYVARSLESEGVSIELRDENLRPFWAQGKGGLRRSASVASEEAMTADSEWAGGRAYARGTGRGLYCPWGTGRGGGRGLGQGLGYTSRNRDGICNFFGNRGRQARCGRGR